MAANVEGREVATTVVAAGDRDSGRNGHGQHQGKGGAIEGREAAGAGKTNEYKGQRRAEEGGEKLEKLRECSFLSTV
jgi:hypothetical protein